MVLEDLFKRVKLSQVVKNWLLSIHIVPTLPLKGMPLIKGHLVKFGQIALYLPLYFVKKAPYFWYNFRFNAKSR